ncbi:MAG: oxidoreductase, partial [Bacteroidales bacterium]|nr:oxidoreductase [Bacteroidales bacterium]
KNGQRTYRSIKVDGKEIEFSGGFTDLHSISYEKILEGKGFGLEAGRSAIETVYKIRNTAPVGIKGDYHPIIKNIGNDL